MKNYMAHHGVKFVKGEIKDVSLQEDGKKLVSFTTEVPSEAFNTVMLAIGRDPNTKRLGLENVGIPLTASGKIGADLLDRTNVENIFAIGDAVEGKILFEYSLPISYFFKRKNGIDSFSY